jgi:hypothetical protein
LKSDGVAKVLGAVDGSLREVLAGTTSMKQDVFARAATAHHPHLAAIDEKYRPRGITAAKQHLAAGVVPRTRKRL